MTTNGIDRPWRRRVGVREVARLAGVSTQTVSRVINNSTNLREDTRQRVLEAMAQLDYRPNNAARALGTATTRTLGVVATDVTLYGPRSPSPRSRPRRATPVAGSRRPTPTRRTRHPSTPPCPTSSGRGSMASSWSRRTPARATPCVARVVRRCRS